MDFIDLFSGLGGFNLALTRLGARCVFASEIDEALQAVYLNNFGLQPHGNIKDVPIEEIPPHDILCAGFPCQPFSKAGEQQGLACPKWGDLIEHVVKIIEHHQPDYLMLENVPNFEHHDEGRTWTAIKEKLEALGYAIESARLSPHRFGIPQIRERMFIVGSRHGLEGFSWPDQTHDVVLTIETILDTHPDGARQLSEQTRACIEVWQDFLDRCPDDVELPSFPIWSMEFGADYPYEDRTPYAIGTDALREYRGSHGVALAEIPGAERWDHLPSYACYEEFRFPDWKIDFIRKNREFYERNREWIDPWHEQILRFPASLQKLEWNCKGEARDIWQYVLQFRASGVRVKRRTTAPSLIAMTTTQVPIIAWEERYMTERECARLQSMDDLHHLPTSQTNTYKAFGNAVNVAVVEMVAMNLFSAGCIVIDAPDPDDRMLRAEALIDRAFGLDDAVGCDA